MSEPESTKMSKPADTEPGVSPSRDSVPIPVLQETTSGLEAILVVVLMMITILVLAVVVVLYA